MKIAFVSSEVVPFVKTGGLADVAGALPKALKNLGCDIKIYIPKYSDIDENKFDLQYRKDIGEIPIKVAGVRSEEHTSELQSLRHLVCRLLLEKKKKKKDTERNTIQLKDTLELQPVADNR